MATFKVTTVMAHFSHFKLVLIIVMALVMISVLVHLSVRDFQEVMSIGQRWTPGYEKRKKISSAEKNVVAFQQQSRSSEPQQSTEESQETVTRDVDDETTSQFLEKTTFFIEDDAVDTRNTLRKAANVATVERGDKKQQFLPNCLIIGFSNAGTTTLKQLLSLHPEIVTAESETQYFTLNIHRGNEWYRRQMPKASASQVVIEETSTYAMSLMALERIHKFNESIKLILVTRDPITRLQADYAEQIKGKLLKPSFEEWCGHSPLSSKVMRTADYATPIQEVFRRFPRKNVLILNKEQVELQPLRAMRQASEFLGLEPGLAKEDFVYNRDKGANCFNTQSERYPEIKKVFADGSVLDQASGCLGTIKGRYKHREIDDAFYEKLVENIQRYNNKLFRVINKRFDWISTEDL